jgi:GTPase
MSHPTPPKVVIVGRTNVGKSTLFNKLIEEQKSLVSNIPGTTRDRYEGDCIWRGRVIRLVDTGGLDVDYSDEIEENIALQARMAMKEADLILFLVDLQAGMQKEDRELAQEFMESKTPVLLVGNKADNVRLRANAQSKEWHKWPLGMPMAISSKTGVGTGDLLDSIFEKLHEENCPPADISDIATTRVTVIGRPNVGKSSLLNATIGEHRFIASNIEHTTREPNDTLVNFEGKDYLFVDTAGVRKLARVHAGKSKLENTGVERTLRAARRSDVVLFVIDITKKIASQDKHLAGKIEEAGASAVIVANKWDLIPDKDPSTINKYEKYIRAHLPMLSFAPIVFTSAETGKRVQVLFDVIDKVFKSRFTQLSLEETKQFISKAIMKHKPSRGKGVAHPHIQSFKQLYVNPPKFALSIRHVRKDVLATSYLRFLKNRLREEYDFEGTPIRIVVRTKKKSHTT